MPRHQIDISTSYSAVLDKPLPAEQLVEVADVDEVQKDNPPMQKPVPEDYLASKGLVQAVDLALALGRPLLLQGEPGCGKTRLAYAVAYALRLPLEECYIKSSMRAQDLLYRYDAVGRLYEAQLPTGKVKLNKASKAQNYIRLEPLGRAIKRAQYNRRSVVLIDEIDKADLDFPNDLLRELDQLEFVIPEVPGLRYRANQDSSVRPLVIVTHNEEKALPAAFLRRCIYYYVPFPATEAELWEIVKVHVHSAEAQDEAWSQKAIEVLLALREMKLVKSPGLSEFLDWVGYLQIVNTPIEELEKLPHLGLLLKQQNDQERAREQWAMLNTANS